MMTTYPGQREDVSVDSLIDDGVKRALRLKAAGLRHAWRVELLATARSADRMLRYKPRAAGFSATYTRISGAPLVIVRGGQS